MKKNIIFAFLMVIIVVIYCINDYIYDSVFKVNKGLKRSEEGMRTASDEGNWNVNDLNEYKSLDLVKYKIPQDSSMTVFAQSCVTNGPSDIVTLLILGSPSNYVAYYSTANFDKNKYVKSSDSQPVSSQPGSSQQTSTPVPTEPPKGKDCGALLIDGSTIKDYLSCVKEYEHNLSFASNMGTFGMQSWVNNALGVVASKNPRGDNPADITWDDARTAPMCQLYTNCPANCTMQSCGNVPKFGEFIKEYYNVATAGEKTIINKSKCDWSSNWGGSC